MALEKEVQKMQQRLQKTVSQGNKLRYMYSFMVFVLSTLKKILIAWVIRNYSVCLQPVFLNMARIAGTVVFKCHIYCRVFSKRSATWSFKVGLKVSFHPYPTFAWPGCGMFLQYSLVFCCHCLTLYDAVSADDMFHCYICIKKKC